MTECRPPYQRTALQAKLSKLSLVAFSCIFALIANVGRSNFFDLSSEHESQAVRMDTTQASHLGIAVVSASTDVNPSATDRGWYDSKSDEIRYPETVIRDRLTDRHKSIRNPTVSPATSTGGPAVGTGTTPIVGWPLAPTVIIVLVILLLLIALFFFMKNHRGVAIRRAASEEERLRHEHAKVVDLPFEISQPVFSLLDECRLAYERGDYQRAIVYLFSYQLVELDRMHFIRLQRGKTNRMYLRELKSRPALRTMVGQSVVAFERVFFGKHRLSSDQFEKCWTQLDAFHQQLKIPTPPESGHAAPPIPVPAVPDTPGSAP